MHRLPKLAYPYNALEPYIDEATMRLHHTKHHQAYIDKLNAALETAPELKTKSLEELLTDLESIPEKIRTVIRNHGGGHFNHNLWWNILRPGRADNQPPPFFRSLLQEAFDDFPVRFSAAALHLFGAGWVWLVKAKDSKLEIAATPNQDNPLSRGQRPLLGLDLWEHAYYLKYQNRRADYIAAFFAVINWDEVVKNYES